MRVDEGRGQGAVLGRGRHLLAESYARRQMRKSRWYSLYDRCTGSRNSRMNFFLDSSLRVYDRCSSSGAKSYHAYDGVASIVNCVRLHPSNCLTYAS